MVHCGMMKKIFLSMVLFRRVCLSLCFLFALATGFVVASPTVFAVRECQCGCYVADPRNSYSGGMACTTPDVCTQAECGRTCGLTNALPGALARGLYPCAESTPTAPQAPSPAPGSDGAQAPAPAPSGSSGSPAPSPSEAPTPRRGTCSFQCVTAPAAGATTPPSPVTPPIVVSCTSDGDCATACTNRCQVPGAGATGNGLSGTQGAGLICSTSAPATCVFPQGDTTTDPAAPASGGGTIRFILPTCTETGNCTLTDVINTAIRVANFLLALSGVVFLFTFLYAGAWLIFFAYDSSAIKKAKDMIVGASIGMIIIMVAGVAIRFVSASFGVSATTTRLPGAAAPSAFRTGTGEGSGPGGARP